MALTDKLTVIANAIRAKTGKTESLTLQQMASEIASIQPSSEFETKSYNQMNAKAAEYIANVAYDPTDYSYSELSGYVVDTAYNKSKPFGAVIDVPCDGVLTLQDGVRNISYNVTAGEESLYNITPNTIGSYMVTDSTETIVGAGLLQPYGSLRMIYCDTDNVRDLGGWSCEGGTVKYGKLFRGGEIHASDAALFHDLLGIRAELDLRWDNEVERDYSLIGSDVDFRHISGPWCTIGAGSSWPSDAHKQILDYVMDNVIAGKPLYFHCAAGADRTGTVAFLLESLLGMSQSDTDKDYELTSFYTGISTDASARRRDEDEWKNFMAQFNAYQGSTMRDRVVNWALTIGITIEKINAFRSAMIDGTPDILTNSVGSVIVTKNLTGVSTDNTTNTNAKYQPYIAMITPESGKLISFVQITMNGADITDSVFSGSESIYRHAVSYQLNNCYVLTLPIRKAVVDGECFCCELRADTGYSISDEDNPIIKITMGDDDMSKYYKDGVINIPRVTGDIVINVTATESAPGFTNQITLSTEAINGGAIYNGTGYKNGYRYNSSLAETENKGTFTTGYIHLTKGDIVRFYGDIFTGTSGNSQCAFYKTNGVIDFQFAQLVFSSGEYLTNKLATLLSDVNYDSTGKALRSFVWNADYDAWAKFTLTGTFIDGTTVITINEEK